MNWRTPASPASATSPPATSWRRRVPLSPLAWLLLVSVAVHGALWAACRLAFRDARPKLFLLGDSGIGNYRLAPGQGLHDALQARRTDWAVTNWAEPGATPLDYFLQFGRGQRLAGAPQQVILAISPDLFAESAPAPEPVHGGELSFWPQGPATTPHRLDEDGANLRWLPCDAAGRDFAEHLTRREHTIALVQQASLPLVGYLDALRSAWLAWVQWPYERRALAQAGPERRRAIEQSAATYGRELAGLRLGDDREFATRPRSLQLAATLDAIHRSGVPTLTVVLPFANPELMARVASPAALANRDLLVQRLRQWLADRREPTVDLNTQEDLSHFRDDQWDDRAHLKSPTAMAYIATRIDGTRGAWKVAP